MTTTPEGWYADPQLPGDPGAQRWWNGASWTAHTRVAPPLAQPSLAAYPPPAPRRRALEVAEALTPSLYEMWDQLTRRPVARAATTEDGAALAPVAARGFALAVDLVSLWVVGGIARGIVGLPLGALDVAGAPLGTWRPLADAAVTLVVAVVWQVAFLHACAATPGKLLLGLRVRSAAPGGALSTGQVLRRATLSVLGLVAGVLSALPAVGASGGFGAAGALVVLWPVLDCVSALGSPRLQALHDRWAGTQVVRAPLV